MAVEMLESDTGPPEAAVPGATRDEFTEFVTAHSPSFVRSAYLLTGDQQLAEDLVQEALARTYLSWRRLQRTGNATAYTRKIMYNRQVSWWRRRKVTETLTEAMPAEIAPSTDVALELVVRQALLELTAKQRVVIVLRFFEDRTEAETADVLGISKSTVHSRTVAALKRLARLVPELKRDLG